MNTEKNNEPQELKCPFCGKTPVYGVFVTSYYFRKELAETRLKAQSRNNGEDRGIF